MAKRSHGHYTISDEEGLKEAGAARRRGDADGYDSNGDPKTKPRSLFDAVESNSSQSAVIRKG